MKLCFICCEYPPGPHGGIGTLIQTLARSLTQNGHQVRVIGIYERNYPAPDNQNDGGVEVIRLRSSNIRFLGWVFARLRLLRIISSWARSGEAELVEVPDYQGLAALWPKLPIPVVTRLSGSATYNAVQQGRSLRKLYAWLERQSLRRADFWFSESVYLANETRRIFAMRTPGAVIYNPVHVPELTATLRSSNIVIFYGTLNNNKGIIPLLRAWPKVLSDFPSAELHVCGKDGRTAEGGSMMEYIRNSFDEEYLRRIIFYGFVPRGELHRLIEMARVAVFPSKSEGFALAPLEAMSFGCPTVYTRRASGPELISNGEEGLLVDPENSEEIASAILTILKDDRVAERLGSRAREKIRKDFSIGKIIAQNEQYFSSCIQCFRNNLPWSIDI